MDYVNWMKHVFVANDISDTKKSQSGWNKDILTDKDFNCFIQFWLETLRVFFVAISQTLCYEQDVVQC